MDTTHTEIKDKIHAIESRQVPKMASLIGKTFGDGISIVDTLVLIPDKLDNDVPFGRPWIRLNRLIKSFLNFCPDMT